MAQQEWSYPALLAMLGQSRRPSFAELRYFVRRVRLELGAGDLTGRNHRLAVRRLVGAVMQVSNEPVVTRQ
ncbi:MAG: hypothetical protein E6Q77_06270 [Rhizobium sp.]|jgi:hypothetical protein|nr:MAG: hypothetical protein E6Q77_06270 [Rhizobium sp.]